MKTIAVLTDFSERAQNAARYALHLAQHLHANIILYNAFYLPSAQPMAAQVAWPMEDYDEIKDDTEKELQLFANKLKQEIPELTNEEFIPSITCQCHFGSLETYIGQLLTDHNIFLLVMANHQKGLSALMLGNHINKIIDNIPIPVLIIPENQTFVKLSKIIFTTNLTYADQQALNLLKDIAMPFHAQIMLAHITADPSTQNSKTEVDNFIKEIAAKINYPNIYHRCIADKHVKSGLQWLRENESFNMLAMVHHNIDQFARLFMRSNSETMAAEIKVPLIIYPCHDGKTN